VARNGCSPQFFGSYKLTSHGGSIAGGSSGSYMPAVLSAGWLLPLLPLLRLLLLALCWR